MVSAPNSKNTIVVWATSADSPNGTAPADAIGKLLIAALDNENIVDDLDEIKP
jgi:D-alanyl-D-alanine carboxypeptidase